MVRGKSVCRSLVHCVALVTLVMVTSRAQTDTYPECVVTHKTRSFINMFNRNGVDLPTRVRVVTVHHQNHSECSLNTTDIIQRFNFTKDTDQYLVGALLVNCDSAVRLHLLQSNESMLDHVIFYVQLTGCITGLQDWQHLSSFANTRVFSALQSGFKVNSTFSQCKGLKLLNSFTYEHLHGPVPNFTAILRCSQTFPETAEVLFSNTSWRELPGGFEELFPNLQSLEIDHNKFTSPPQSFPWANDTLHLPLNLSRTPTMQDQYSVAEGLTIPSNVFRRILNMKYNLISRLEDYAFHGYLDMITLKGNNISFIGSNTFQNVTGLQHLDLSENNLELLPDNVFKGLQTLKVLEISANRLKFLKHNNFKDLINLETIDLSNNSITTVEPGMFTNMRNIKVIHLEFNNLSQLNPDSFPVDSITLEEIYLNNNPLKTIPEFVFWIRSLTMADLHSSEINLDNFTEYLTDLNTLRIRQSIIDTASDNDMRDLYTRADKLRKIDLHSCHITSLYIEFSKLPKRNLDTFLSMLLHFEFVLNDNPINCDCKIMPISNFINGYVGNGTISRKEYFFTNWVCIRPVELAGRPMLTVEAAETYCGAEAGIEIKPCPMECNCYRRSINHNTIVDCRNNSLSHVHSILPTGDLEMWYAGNDISKLDSMPELSNVVELDLSKNRLQYLEDDVFSNMHGLKQLHLESNLLSYLPQSIQSLHLLNVTLHPNPFQCDCHSLWLKHWIQQHKRIVQGWYKITCSVDSEVGQVLVEVSDDRFKCPEKVDTLKTVIISSVSCSIILILLLIITVMLYTYRLEAKVFLFINFGIHPFDNDKDDKNETIDCVIAHSGDQTDWVMEQIVEVLEGEDYKFVVCDMARDFVVGLSFHDNLSRVVNRSKRMVFCLSEKWNTDSDSFSMAWGIAQKKISELKSNFGIIVTHGIGKDQITDKELLRFMKSRRFVDSADRMFLDKIIYYMPRKEKDLETKAMKITTIQNAMDNFVLEANGKEAQLDDVTIEMRLLQIDRANLNDTPGQIFVSYADDDLQYVIRDLQPKLEQHGYNLCIPDRDFVVGASKEENILQAIGSSMRTVFVLSGSHLQDEWSLFTFRTAYEKSLRETSNHLIVIAREDVELEHVNEEIRNYLVNYIYLHVNDRWFDRRLFNSLPNLELMKIEDEEEGLCERL